MPPAVLVRGGRRVALLPRVPSPPVVLNLSLGPPSTGESFEYGFTRGVPEPLVTLARRAGPGPIVTDPLLARALKPLGLSASPWTAEEFREARAGAPPSIDPIDRELVLAIADRRLLTRLADPEEQLISLAREEERLERAVMRERSSAEQIVAPPGSPLETHLERSRKFAESFAQHHAALVDEVDALAQRVLPNLSAVVGPKVAGRLLALAGSKARLARMASARLQLLGSRRRPARRGPRFGVIARAATMGDVPLSRHGAYARSLAAIAVIAARADGTTGRNISTSLLVRRDRRRAQLRRMPP